MSRVQSTKQGNNQAIPFARSHDDAMRQLLRLEEPFTAEEMGQVSDFNPRTLNFKSVIRSVDAEETGHGLRHYWVIRQSVRDDLEKHFEERDELPCGHGGVRNLGNGTYSCAFDACDQTFDRETVEEALEW